MKPALRKMVERHIAERRSAIESEIEALNQTEIWLAQNPTPTWRVSIHSAWASDGEKSHAGEYMQESLLEAMRLAATDFCRLNRRVMPGQPIGHGQEGSYDFWDVQGWFYVSLVAGDTLIPIPDSSFAKHVLKIKKRGGTKINYYDPKTVSPQTHTIP